MPRRAKGHGTRKDARRQGTENVMIVQGQPTDPRLPENCLELALMIDVYQEFSHPCEMLKSCAVL